MNNSTAPHGDALAGPQTPAGRREPPGADPAAELEAARQAQAIAEARAAQLEAERDAAVAARESLRSLAAHLIGERGYLAGQLIRAYQRPWRPLKFALEPPAHELDQRGEPAGLKASFGPLRALGREAQSGAF